MELSGIYRKLGGALIILVTVITSYGCTHSVRYFVRPDTDLTKIKKVAVLPFENHTQDRYANEKIRELVMMGLLKRGVDVIEPGEVNDILRLMRIRSVKRLTKEEIIEMGKRLNIDAIITGSVNTYEKKRALSVTYPEVSIYINLIDTDSGNILWATWHTSGGADFWTRHFGIETKTIDEVSQKVVKEALDTVF